VINIIIITKNNTINNIINYNIYSNINY